jgi:hypothetical protein
MEMASGGLQGRNQIIYSTNGLNKMILGTQHDLKKVSVTFSFPNKLLKYYTGILARWDSLWQPRYMTGHVCHNLLRWLQTVWCSSGLEDVLMQSGMLVGMEMASGGLQFQ